MVLGCSKYGTGIPSGCGAERMERKVSITSWPRRAVPGIKKAKLLFWVHCALLCNLLNFPSFTTEKTENFDWWSGWRAHGCGDHTWPVESPFTRHNCYFRFRNELIDGVEKWGPPGCFAERDYQGAICCTVNIDLVPGSLCCLLINQSINQSINQWTNQKVHQSINQSMD